MTKAEIAVARLTESERAALRRLLCKHGFETMLGAILYIGDTPGTRSARQMAENVAPFPQRP